MIDKINKITNKVFGKNVDEYYIPGYSTNEVYIVQIDDKKYCIKISDNKYLSAFRSEPYIQKKVKNNTNIPIPSIIKIDFSRELIKDDYFIMEFIDGKNAKEKNIKNEFKVTKELEKYSKELDKIKFNNYGYFTVENNNLEIFPEYKTWEEILENEVKIMCNYMMQNRFKYLSEYHLKLFKEYKHILNKYDTETSLVNSDLRPANILLDNKNNIKAVLDWGSCFCGENFYNMKKMEFLLKTPGNSLTYNISEKHKPNDKINKFYNALMWMYIMGGFNKWYNKEDQSTKYKYEKRIRNRYKKDVKELKNI